MLLIHPPSVRNCEPPVALLNLKAALESGGCSAEILDGAAEAYHWLSLQDLQNPQDRRGRSCEKKVPRLWQSLGFPQSYKSLDRFKKDLSDLQYAAQGSLEPGFTVTPSDFAIQDRSPLRISDIQYAYDHPEESPFYGWFRKRLADFLPELQRVGISIGYLSQVFCGAAMMGYIARTWSDIKIQLGGGLITSWLKGPWDCSFLDKMAHSVVSGPGERDVLAFAGGKSIPKGGLPDPGDLYQLPYIAPGRILPYAASRGCSWRRCTFCNERWEGSAYRSNAVERSVKELHSLSKLHDPRLIHLCDSEISLELMQAIIERPPGPPWYSFSRFFPALLDLKFCKDLADSNCAMLCLGLESAEQRVLNHLKKGILLSQVRIILQNLREVGIKTYVYVMFGTPMETQGDARTTRDFLVEMAHSIDYINAAVFSMPILSRELKDEDTHSFYQGDLSLYKDFRHPRGFSRRMVREFLSKEFYGSSELKAITKRTPPTFTSNLAAFF